MANKRRLIDKTPLIHAIGDYMATNAYLNDTALDVLKLIARWVDEAPTVEAVRCKDCKWWSTGEVGYYDDEGWCANPCGLDDIANEDDFCYYGER